MKNLNLYQQIILLTAMFFLLLIIIAVFHEDGILTIHEFENELIQFRASNESLIPKNNSIVIASVFGELTVKLLKKKHNAMFLVSSSSNYPSFEVKEEMDCFIWGIVTYVIHSTIAA